MAVWESSGAFALYGVIAGSGLTSLTALLIHRSEAARAEAERKSKAEEAIRDRDHELDLDRLRSARAGRERTYPGIAARVQASSALAARAAFAVIQGGPPETNLDEMSDRLDSGEVGAEIVVFGSTKSIEAWHACLVAEQDLNLALRQFVADAEWQGPAPEPIAHPIRLLLDVVQMRVSELYDSMREDLVWRPSQGAQS